MMSLTRPQAAALSNFPALNPSFGAIRGIHHQQPCTPMLPLIEGHAIRLSTALRQKCTKRQVARRQGFTVAAASSSQVRVRLVVPQQALQFGEQIKCVGEDANLGNWYDKAAPFLSWTEGDTWIHHTSLPSGSHSFKLVLIKDGGEIFWEDGADRVIEIPNDVSGTVEVSCQFNNTAATEVSVVEDTESSSEEEDIPASTSAQQGADEGSEAVAGLEVEKQPQSKALVESTIALDDDEKPSEVQQLSASEVNQDLPAVAEQSMFAEEVEEEGNAENQASSAAEQPQAHLDSSALGQPEEAAAQAEPVQEAKPSKETEAAAKSDEASNGSGKKAFKKGKTTVLQDKSMVVTFDESDEEEDAATLAERLYSGSGGL